MQSYALQERATHARPNCAVGDAYIPHISVKQCYVEANGLYTFAPVAC